MRVSILIPTFNRAVYLETAISSALAQDYKDLEIVISDNASVDNTQEVAKVYLRDSRVKYFRNPENIGLVRNWQKAIIERSTGDWFLLLSDDDVLNDPTFISQAVKLIESKKDVTVVYSNSYVYDESLNTLTKLDLPFAEVEDGLRVFSLRGTVRPQDFALCNVLFNKKLATGINAFSNINNLSCDSELFLRLCLLGNVGVLKSYSSIYRVHSSNILKLISKDAEQVIGSLDSLIKPLLEARQRGVSRNILIEFVRNSGLKREILVCMLKTAVVSKERVKQLYRQLRETLGEEDYGVLPSKFAFGILTLFSRSIAPLFIVRRRILYFRSSLQRSLFGNQVFFAPLKKNVYLIK